MRQLDRQTLGEAGDAVFEGGIGDIVGVAAEALDRGQVDDAAAAPALDDQRRRRPCDDEHVAQIDVVEGVDLLVGHRLQGFDAAQMVADIVHQYVEPAMGPLDLFHHLGDVGGLLHVGLDRRAVGAAGEQCRVEIGDLAGVDFRHDHLAAEPDESLGDGAADAGPATGDQCDFVLERDFRRMPPNSVGRTSGSLP